MMSGTLNMCPQELLHLPVLQCTQSHTKTVASGEVTASQSDEEAHTDRHTLWVSHK